MPIPRPAPEARIKAALWFAERGFGVFSVWSADASGACRCQLKDKCANAGKHPIGNQGFHDCTRDPGRITTLLSAGSEPNYGLVCPDGVFALDVDGDGIARLDELEARLGMLPRTLRTRTAHGYHVFMRWPPSHPRPIGQMFGYVTRWGSGSGAGYVIGPRSVHASGAVYEPDGTHMEIAELPEAWAAAVVAPAARDADEITVTGGYRLPEPGYTGARYDAIRDYAASRYMRGIDKSEVWAGVAAVLAPRFASPLSEQDLRDRFDRAWRGTAVRLGQPRPQEQPAARPSLPGIDAVDLLALDLPPLRWIVPDLLPEGTTVLAAPPKVGKSCLVYQIAVEAAIGGDLLGRRVSPGSVLYLALEDGQRRGADRLRKVLAGRTMPRGRLEVRWSAQQIGKGLEGEIEAWLRDHPDAVMVAVDTLGKARGGTDGRRNAYEVDVEAMRGLQDLFRDRAVALVIVHHARKDASDDFLASVSGTYGITGSVDTIVVIQRKRLERFGVIKTTGRDIADQEIPVQFADGLWTSAPASLPAGSFERSEVYRLIEEVGPVFPKAIADELGMERTAVQHMVSRLVADGAVARTTGGYSVAKVTLDLSSPPHHSLHSESDMSDGGHARPQAREADLSVECADYAAHTFHHVRRGSRFTCLECSPEDPA